MERIKDLDLHQKGILLLLCAMIVVFGVIYSIETSHVGYLYYDEILEFREDSGNAVYAGTINGLESCFTVASDKTVTFQHGEKIYGPYILKIDPTAVPEEKDYLTGIEILEGAEVFFRGGYYRMNGDLMLYDEKGSMDFPPVVVQIGDTVVDGNGNGIDPMEPSVHTILELMFGPELDSMGEWIAYLFGVILSVFTAVSILFADELFRFRLSFQVQDAYQAEPTDFEMIGRYIGWTVMTVAVLVLYMVGLRSLNAFFSFVSFS